MSKADVVGAANMIRIMVLDQMIEVFSSEMDVNPTHESMMEVIESGEFPEITGFYNKQVNIICDHIR